MKKILPYILTLVVLAGIISPTTSTLKTFAQSIDPAFETLDTTQPVDLDPVTGGFSNPAATGNISPGGSTVTPASTATPLPKFQGCTSMLPPFINFTACFANIVYLIMWIFSWILYIAGKILDMSLYFTLHMSDLMVHVPVVDIGWKIFRDLANIFFIFILLWTAISTILGLGSGKSKEILVNLIVVALLMNFSLFITKTVVDASNIVALHFYNLIVTPPVQTKTENTVQNAISYFSNTINVGSSFSGAFMEGLKIQTLYSSQTAGGKAIDSVPGGKFASEVLGGETINFGKIILIGGLGIALMLTAAYVFFVASILFIIRAVVLMMVMLLSPLAFLAFILPSTEGYADAWKESLIRQSIFAPIYLALCFVVVKTIQSDAFRGVMTVSNSSDSVAAIFSPGASSLAGFGLVFNFVLLIALMLGSILVAKKMEAHGVESAVEIGKAARGFVGRQLVRGTYVTAATSSYSYIVGKAGKAAERVGFLRDAGKSIQEHATRVGEKGEKLQKKIDVNELDRQFKASKFGTTEIGQFIRERTTAGAIFGTKATFGSEKSAHEAYEESEKLRDQAQEVFRADEVKKAAEALQAEEKNPTIKTRAELLATKPVILPTNDKGKPMTEDEWVSSEQERLKKETKNRLINAVQSAVVRLPSTGLIHLQEGVIKTVIPHATEKQVEELINSSDGGWTQKDKEEFLEVYFDQLKKDAEQFQKESDELEQKKQAYEKKVREGKFKIDQTTGKVVVEKGRAILEKPEIDPATGLMSTSEEIPKFEKTDAYNAVYSKTRRYMSLKGFELLNITKFHFSDETKRRLAEAGKDPEEGNLFRAVPVVGKIMKWGTAQDIRDPNKTHNFTDKERIDIRYIKDADLVELIDKLRNKRDEAGNFLYQNTPEEREEAIRTGDFKLLKKDLLWEDRLRDFLQGRAASESANTPGAFRKNPEYARFMGAEALREFAKKDPNDVTKLLEDAFTAFKENEEGKRVMNFETKQLIRDLIQTKEGWKIGQKMTIPGLQAWRERLEKDFREDPKKTVKFTDWSALALKEEERNKKLEKILEIRKAGAENYVEPAEETAKEKEDKKTPTA